MYLEVAVASPIESTLTYQSNPDFPESSYCPGMRVMVPMGPRLITGYILSRTAQLAERPTYTIRPIHDLLDNSPLFPASMVPFFQWLADYYHYPIGEVIKCALPGGLTPQSGRQITITPLGQRSFEQSPPADFCQQKWYQRLCANGKLSQASTRQLWRGKTRKILEKWAQAGYISITQEISTDSIKAKTEICYRLKPMDTAPKILSTTEAKTLAILTTLAEDVRLDWVPKKEITRGYSGAAKALNSLLLQEAITMEEHVVYRNPFGERPPSYPAPLQLSSEQALALQSLQPALASGQFSPFLLHGVTGSGKTEVYLRAAEQTLAQGKTALVLVPEIALATQLEGNFLSRFADQVGLLHSGLSQGERYDQWRQILEQRVKIVIGARSALFAPLEDIGLIIIDEEHDGAYKQEDSFRYQARDAAVMRASQNRAVIILGSATPSVVSYQHALTGKYTLLEMTKRVEDKPLPKVEIIDLKSIPTTSGKTPLFSPQLVKSLKETLHSADQSILFLNRRGYAQLMLCQSCGLTIQCSHCNISLTFHKGKEELVCHYCGYSIKSPSLCPNCQAAALITVGFGTERVEAELKKILPQARVARLDRDTALNRKEFIRILKQVHQREIDILVGTQMIAKGHHFPGVTFVGVIWADASLGIPDYKAGERTFQVLTQVFGRAGRGEKHGHVIVQTHHPKHYCIETAKEHDYRRLFDQELTLRQRLSYPPFSRLVTIRFEGRQSNAVKNCALAMAQFIKHHPLHQALEILGPSPAPLAILRDLHRWQLLIKSSNLTVLHQVSTALKAHKTSLGGLSSVKLTIDVDPESML